MRIPRVPLAVLALVALMLAVTQAVPLPQVVVSFDEWMTPSNPPYPHDPEVAPDGSV